MYVHMYVVLHLSPFKNEFEGGGIFPPNDIVALLETVSKLLCQKISIILYKWILANTVPSCNVYA